MNHPLKNGIPYLLNVAAVFLQAHQTTLRLVSAINTNNVLDVGKELAHLVNMTFRLQETMTNLAFVLEYQPRGQSVTGG